MIMEVEEVCEVVEDTTNNVLKAASGGQNQHFKKKGGNQGSAASRTRKDSERDFLVHSKFFQCKQCTRCTAVDNELNALARKSFEL